MEGRFILPAGEAVAFTSLLFGTTLEQKCMYERQENFVQYLALYCCFYF